ncbi:protein SICKLE-like [Forsythia ovata]|uniref:Protein SICKLE-like n=1 Tax=Forsythia ovata TaxID=205694 RepID=A0ABD1RQ75_9LAMI
MEESEKRMERMKVIQMEATQVGTNVAESLGMVARYLSNPLIEGETISTTQVQHASPRFDYYTNPMSSFSVNKMRSQVSHQDSRGYHNMPPGHGMCPYPGHGRSFGSGISPGPVSAELRPDLYCKCEMVEDPWKQLNPVIRKSHNVSTERFETSILRNAGFQNPLA